MRWLLILSVSVQLFGSPFEEITPSTPEEILSLTSNLLVEGFVSATSGQLVFSETDLCVKGAQDLVLKRTYIPPQVLGRYEAKEEKDQYYLGKALCQLRFKGWVVYPHLWAGINRHSPYFQIRDPQGFVLEFEIKGNQGVLKNASYGCSNLRGEEASSRNDIRNISLYVDGFRALAIWPDGLQRHYSPLQTGVYRLEKEVLPNGKIIRYEYTSQGFLKISACDPKGQFSYASITQVGANHYVGSDGKEVKFVSKNREIKGKSKKHKKKEEFSFKFPVMVQASNPTYQNIAGYNERSLLTSYDTKAYPISCSYEQNKNALARIQTFSTPSGSTKFSYNPAIPDQKDGSTVVIHPDGVKTVYRFNQKLLLAAIENWREAPQKQGHRGAWSTLGSSFELVNKKTFEYDHKQHIKRIETRDGESNLLIAKRFECDNFGNPILEQTEGDVGLFSIKRTFDKNRLTSETRDDGLQTQLTYLGDTWLVTSKTTLEWGRQLRKTIFVYDSANNLIQELEENKTKTHYTLYQTGPHLHRIEWEEKWDWEGKLVHKIHYAYDRWGNTVEEQHLDATGQFAYKILRTYNEKGELLTETNPLAQTASYQYDLRGRCIQEIPISNGLFITRTFDQKGRLLLLRENDHETRFGYNSSDELIERIDYLGYSTKYHYDAVHGKPDQIEEAGTLTKIEYDPFGREKLRVDANGAKTARHTNSYGKVTKIIHPEGSMDTYTYAPNGLIKSHTDPDGLHTTYVHDALGRVTQETRAGATTFFRFDGYNLLATTDPEGIITAYKYDLLDRKIEEKRHNRITRYGYDSLGFLAWEKRGDRCIAYTHDLMGQLRTKSIDNVLVKSWTYDQAGNIASIEFGGMTTFQLDAHNRLIEKTDPEGHKTKIQYKKGVQQLIKKSTDPTGVVTIETYNPKGQLLWQEVGGRRVQERTYNNLFQLQSQDHITFQYTPNGNKESMNEAGRRTTKWTYTPGNRIRSKQKPDGSFLHYQYDAQGRLISIGDRTFRYDALNRLIEGTGFSRQLDAFGNITREDFSNGLWIETSYDNWDRPTKRTLSDQSQIAYHYEGPFLQKVTRISRDGTEKYAHTYDQRDARGNVQLETGLFATRHEYDKSGKKKAQMSPYFQETVDYDPRGNLIRQGSTTFTYDDLSQMTSQSEHFSASYDVHYNLRELNGQPISVDALNQIEGVSYDPNGNVLKPGFVYDAFDQLVQAEGETFVYDALGRRLQQGNTSYLFIGDEEIGAFEDNKPKELKISGVTPIAIEIADKPYVPIQDVQGTIRLLIDRDTQEIVQQNHCDAFGAGLTAAIPYAYAGKRYDPKLNLVYFGKRDYDPSLRRWLTPDPIGPVDHSNLYQYVFNNPYLYQDPDGQFVAAFALPLLFWGTEFALPAISTMVTWLAYGAATGAVAYGSYKLIEACNEGSGTGSDIIQEFVSFEQMQKNTEVYVPDRPLPNTPDGVHIPDTDAPHTQLGTQRGRKGPYPQAREFDEHGNPVRDIDFTDHDRPDKHPNPHQHRHIENKTGGTPERSKNPEPVAGWKY